MVEEVQGKARYTAFISYSHKDAAVARWLHRRLEGYRLPNRLVGTIGEHGTVPARLTPIFRDREELPAAGDLSEKVRAALAASDNLIVICSPHAAASPWVGREICAFRDLHPDRPVFAAIVAGDPDQSFHPDLRFLSDGAAIEPLAADLRREGDGRRLGLLKLVAGLAGVGLDAVVQRDTQRRLRRVTAVTVSSLAGMLLMTLLAIFALTARAEAERQRAEAEGLVEYMLTDLRDRLEGVGRLDVLTSVNRRAQEYYQVQDLNALPADSLERRARILHAMGEDDMKRGDVERALAQFREASRTTAALLADNPNDPERIFAHSQSEFWVGYVDYERRNYAAAKAPFQRYKFLADRLLAIDPNDPHWLKEAAYAEGNLCSIALEEPRDAPAALRSCVAALHHMEAAAKRIGNPAQTDKDLANRHGWIADAYFRNDRWDLAFLHRRKQEQLLASLAARDPKNMDLRDLWVTNQMALAGLERRTGKATAARARLAEALTMVEALVRADPSNKQWVERRADVQKKISSVRPHL